MYPLLTQAPMLFDTMGVIVRCIIPLVSMLLLATAASAAELHVIDHSPLTGKTAVSRSATISITFDSAVTPTAATEAPIRVFTSQGALVPCTASSDGPNSVTLTPEDPLLPGMPITVHIPTGLTGTSGEVLAKGYQWSFWTESTQTGLHFQTELVHAGHQPFALAAGDYDENGSLDLVVVEGGALDEVVLLSNSGNANFTETLRVPIANSAVHAVSADFDLDGHLDLAVGHWSTQQVSVLFGDGLGGLFAPVSYPLGASSHKLACGDLDGDGYPEILSANRLEGNLSILRNNGDGSFLVDPPVTVGSGTRDVTLGDWDEDGSLDILVAASHVGYGIHLNDGAGGFSWFAITRPSLPDPSKGDAQIVAFLPIFWWNPTLIGMAGDAPSFFTGYHGDGGNYGVELEVGDHAEYLSVADIDGNQSLDLVFVNYLDGRLMFGRDPYESWERGFLPILQDRYAPPEADLGDIRNPLVADLDGDGDNDIVTAYRAGGEVHLWRNGSPEDAPPLAWRRMEVQPPPGHQSELRSRIEIADDGTIHCLYRTYIPFEYDENLVHSVFRNGVWTDTDLGILRNNSPPSGMANFWTRLDPSGTLHLAWLGGWAPGEAWYATWEDGVWTRERLPISGPMTMVPSAGYPPLIFTARSDTIYSMERIDDQWIANSVYGGFPGGAFEGMLAADRLEDGTPVLAIAYISGTHQTYSFTYLKVGSPQAGEWSFEIVDRALYSLHGLRIDGTQEPIVAYTRAATGFSSRIARFNGSQWTTEYAERWADCRGCADSPSAFGVDPTGRPWVVGYKDIFVRGDDHWDHVPFEGKQRWGDISFDAEGHPWISNIEDWKLAIYTTSPRDVVTAVDPGGDAPVPRNFTLGDAVPNPFNPSTTISYSTPRASQVELEIYDLAGRHVRTLVSDPVDAGTHEVTWSGTDDAGTQVASGVYLYQLRAGEFVETRRMVLLR